MTKKNNFAGKKILFLVPSLKMGGMERVLVTYSNLLAKAGYKITVLNYSSDDPILVSQLSPEIRYIRYYRPVPNVKQATIKDVLRLNFRVVSYDKWLRTAKPRKLHKKIIKEKYDVEISFFGAELIRVISGCNDGTTKRVCWIHNENTKGIFEGFRTKTQKKKVYENIDDIICVSDVVKENVRQELPWHNGIKVLYNPNDTQYIRDKALETTQVPEKKRFTFAMVCRLSVQHKGLDRMIECVSRLERRYSFDVWLVGNGPDRKKIENMIEESGVKSISLLGQQENPYKYMRAADMFLCTSRYEGFSLVMSEALALGKPILTTKVSGACEMLGNSEYGYIVENSVEGIYNGMERILSDTEMFEHYVKKAEERKDYFSEDRIIEMFEEIIGI